MRYTSALGSPTSLGARPTHRKRSQSDISICSDAREVIQVKIGVQHANLPLFAVGADCTGFRTQKHHALETDHVSAVMPAQCSRERHVVCNRTWTQSASTVPPPIQLQWPVSDCVGGGPAGLAAACALSDLGFDEVEVWDELAPPQPSDEGEWGTTARSYNLGVTTRGQRMLRQIGALDRVKECAALLLGRQEWSPESPAGARTRRAPTPSRVDATRDTLLDRMLEAAVIQRDRLVAILLEHVRDRYSGRVRVRHCVRASDLALLPEDDSVLLSWQREDDGSEGAIRTSFVVGCDGTNSTVRDALAAADSRVRKVDLPAAHTTTRVYKSIVMDLPGGDEWPYDIGYSERSAGGRVFECLPTREGKLIGLVLFKHDDAEVLGLQGERQVRDWLALEFPHLYPRIPAHEVAAFATRPVGRLPSFRYVGPHLHHGASVVLVGDAIHTVKPYFGLGLNSALEDVELLVDSLAQSPNDREKALASFTAYRAPDARALVEMSHTADKGFLFFVVPIILDRFFSTLAPAIFSGPTIRLMQTGELRFSKVQEVKRRERALQLVLLACLTAAALWIARTLLQGLRCLASSPVPVV